MINLLPQNEKNNLFLKRIKNLVIILGAVITICLICFILILLSLKFYILADVGYQKLLLQDTQEKYQSPDITTLKDTIQKYNKLLPSILSFYQKRIYFSDTLDVISEIERPQGLYFTNISINESNKIGISGFSPTRDDLITFQKNLEKQGKIKNISFSADSWINPTKVNFNLTMEYGN
jgi:Tfp pilus assembly protein PilN